MKIVTIKTNGECELIDEEWNLIDFNTFVDGWIESLTYPNGTTLIINDCGKLIGLDTNLVATAISVHLFEDHPFYDLIVGNAILIGPTDCNGNYTSVPDDVIETLKKEKILL